MIFSAHFYELFALPLGHVLLFYRPYSKNNCYIVYSFTRICLYALNTCHVMGENIDFVRSVSLSD